MATSSRQSALFGVQDWKRIYQTFREADFQSYDYETLRKSFIDYLTQYYPETYNDYIESSEFVALLDVMAFMGQALAFRDDLNARENFIDTAERRDSVVKLANLVSYTPKRNLAGQGLLKLTAVSTSETVYDINGNNLSGTTILWNDPANPAWQEQFNSILNATFLNSQRVGRPGNSQTILGVTTDEYTVNLASGQLPVLPYQAQIDGVNMSFELVSVTSLNSTSLYELPPAPSSQFNMLYRNDKLGFGSPNTGFFFYFKQGTLQNYDFNFIEAIENNFQEIDIQGINNTDTWLYAVNSTGTVSEASRWQQVENLFINADLQGTSARPIFTVTSRFNDQVTYVFGDGVFGKVPVGPFRAYVRSSNGLNYTIDPSEMNGIVVGIPYISRQGRNEVLTITLSLQTTVNNAQQRESLAQIKERAPARYYTQNRMVNGEDYTNFPFTLYNSIIKSAALNRSSIGVSRNQDLLDPTGKYSSTNVFGDDGALWYTQQPSNSSFSTLSINIAVEYLSLTFPQLLNSPDAIQYYQYYYPRYTGGVPIVPTPGAISIDGRCYWKTVTVSGNTVTGYFYVVDGAGNQIPIPVGSSSSYPTGQTYITKGAQLKFVAPAGYYFDRDNRLQQGTPNPAIGDRTTYWIGVSNVVGDGFNFGQGTLNNGNGPVTFNTYVPTGAFLDTTSGGTWDPATRTGPTGVLPAFDNTLGADLVRRILTLIQLKSDFLLKYDNSLLATQERWSIEQFVPINPTPTDYFAKFTYSSIDDTYNVEIRNLNYYFGSVNQVRFLFTGTQLTFDPRSGASLRDSVTVLRTNSNSNYNPSVNLPGQAILGVNYPLFVTGQQIQSDGYPDDFAVKISTLNTETGLSYDPDFFYDLVGLVSNPIPPLVFFRVITDVNDLYRLQLLPPAAVNIAYPTQAAITSVIYEYPVGTLFYATTENQFYQSFQVAATDPPVLQLNNVSANYAVQTGRNTINFQYQHNSSNTTRIDPATTNIIDLYLVTQSYYTQYQNWLNDTTGTVPEPPRPTVNELQSAYSNLDNYKMISDSVIPNSVTFKPLFGTKAAPALRGTIKVIKSPTTTASDSQIRSSTLAAMNSYFTLDKWDFGDTFYMSELTAYLHVQLGGLISSVVLVPADPSQTFGDLYEIRSAPNEIFVNGATATDIIVIASLSPQSLQR